MSSCVRRLLVVILHSTSSFMGTLDSKWNSGICVLREWKSTVLELFFLPIWTPLGTDGKYSVLSCQGQVQEIFVRGAWKWRRSMESGCTDRPSGAGRPCPQEGGRTRTAPTTVSHSPPLSSGAQLALHAAPSFRSRGAPESNPPQGAGKPNGRGA